MGPSGADLRPGRGFTFALDHEGLAAWAVLGLRLGHFGVSYGSCRPRPSQQVGRARGYGQEAWRARRLRPSDPQGDG